MDTCAKQLAITIKREAVPGPTLIQKVLQQASSKTLPDVLMLDNPDIQQIAETGALAPLGDFGDQRRRDSRRAGVGGDVRRQALRPAARGEHDRDLLQQGHSGQGRRQAARPPGTS